MIRSSLAQDTVIVTGSPTSRSAASLIANATNTSSPVSNGPASRSAATCRSTAASFGPAFRVGAFALPVDFAGRFAGVTT